MTSSSYKLQDPGSRGHMHRGLQRKVAIGAVIAVIVCGVVLIPLIADPELRLDVARRAGLVSGREGELVASGDSGASLVVLPSEHNVEGSDRTQLRFLAAFIAYPEGEQLRLEPLNGGEDLTVPLASYDLISTSPDASIMYIQGPSQAALIDVSGAQLIEVLPSEEAPNVTWDWQTAVWQRGVGLCDLVSNTATWIGCFHYDVLITDLMSDWRLDLERYGGSDEAHTVAVGLGLQPVVGFTENDEWLYVYNENGIRRFSVAEVTAA